MLFQTKLLRHLGVAILFISLAFFAKSASAASRYYYQIKIYRFKDKAQQQTVDTYLKEYYLPTLHKMGFKNIGVFKTQESDTARRTYVFVPFKSWKALEGFGQKIAALGDEATTGKDYINADSKTPPYTRTETMILSAFSTRLEPKAPTLTGDRAARVYELRSYESPTEKYHYNKVKMFDSGETDLFDRINSNAVFYGSVVAGSHMPNLMYMTCYADMKDRDKHWEAFGAAPEWKALTAQDQYKNNVSKNEIVFLHPTEYSDF
ncbi:NIPSNAP family protein [Mucilaginibacter gilvus]|uniref:NIPSNAP family containing protein n=1 Tax=Mucilaginibacter gilvus TaxID=2305909 RepID=A0A444MPX9_9SPHI|nr:NIPSNAP family protein [Mucilaginibacter gilvus]RWY53669.1 NIPSNAP family containing protein [Mucilaginibacter gilvus]